MKLCRFPALLAASILAVFAATGAQAAGHQFTSNSSKVAVAAVAIAPLPAPSSFAMVGVGALSLVGLQALKRRRA